MKMKVEVEVPIYRSGNKVTIESIDALNKIMGTTSATNQAHKIGLKKVGPQKWEISMNDLRLRQQTMVDKAKDYTSKADFLGQVIDQLSEEEEYVEFDAETNVLQPQQTFGMDTGGKQSKNPQQERMVKRSHSSWCREEHQLIMENLHLLQTNFSSHRELAEYLKPQFPNRTMQSLEQRISKSTRGKAKMPKRTRATLEQRPTGTYTRVKRGESKSSMAKWTIEEHQLIVRNIGKLNTYATIQDFAKALLPYLPGRSLKSVELRVGKTLRGKVSTPKVSKVKPVKPKPLDVKPMVIEGGTPTKFVTVKPKPTGKPSGKGKRWLPEEEKVVIENYQLGNGELKKLLVYKRSSQSIATKKWELRTKGKIPSTPLTGTGERGRKSSPTSSSVIADASHTPTPIDHNTDYMIRKKPLDPITQTPQYEMGNYNTRKDDKFPAFSMIPHQAQNLLITTIKQCVFQKGKIAYKDITWIHAYKNWNWALWNDFVTEFLMNAKKISNYYGIENKFTIEKDGKSKCICYRKNKYTQG